ncbi:Uncharacterised protein [Mycobacteroides abscessus]|nr:Uncharacterised protein [Mycobacteroides abscessus]CPW40962.1 Uncharacterised protein [Mycobacteroides abscessus]
MRPRPHRAALQWWRLESAKSVHGHNFHTITPGFWPVGQPLLERCLGTAGDHIQQPGRARLVADAGEVDDHGDVLVPVAGVAPHVLIDPYHLHTVEPAGVFDQDALALR